MENGTIVIPPYVYKVLGLENAAAMVYGIIYGFTIGKQGKFYGNLRFISEITGLSRETVCRILKKLTEKGYIKKTVVDTLRNEYQCVPYKELIENGLITEKQSDKTKRKTAARPSKIITDCEKQDNLYQGIGDTEKPQENAENSDFQLSSEIVEEKPKPPKIRQPESEVLTPIAMVWQAYKQAYYERYAAYPLQNAKVMGQIKQFIAQVGQDNAAAIAVFFVSHNNSWYVQKKHDIGTLLMNAQAVAVDWQKVTQTTRQAAQWEEQHAAAMGAAEEAKRIIRQRHEQKQKTA